MKINCPCGYRIPDITDKLSSKARYVTDRSWFEYMEKETHGMISDFKHRFMWQCYQCGRLAIDDAENEIHFFKPEGQTPKMDILS